ncbi:MAG: DNA polymerase III subunit beta [Thermoflexibacteraceae bacterium]|jgi:DNA polymerase-3 subunit beta
MKFIISSANLLKQVGALNGVILSNPIMPILENFLFKVENNKLIITASDMQNTMTAEVAVDSDEDGKVAIPAKMLIETLKNLPEQPVTIVMNAETYAVEIISDKGRYRLAGENADDFPEPLAVKATEEIEFPAEVLSSAIAYTLFAVSNDEMKPSMNGVFVQLSPNHVTFVSTDSHRLVRYRRDDVKAQSEVSVILPKKALNLLKNALPTSDIPVVVTFNKSNAFFTFGNMKLVCRLIDERFPDYENVIPLNNSNNLTINRVELLGSLKRISIYANKSTNLVKLKLGGETMTVSAEDLDFSNEANEALSCDYNGNEMEIGFQARMLMEMLSNLATNEVYVKMSEPNRAVLMLPTSNTQGEDVLMLAMPVSLTSYYY